MIIRVHGYVKQRQILSHVRFQVLRRSSRRHFLGFQRWGDCFLPRNACDTVYLYHVPAARGAVRPPRADFALRFKSLGAPAQLVLLAHAPRTTPPHPSPSSTANCRTRGHSSVRSAFPAATRRRRASLPRSRARRATAGTRTWVWASRPRRRRSRASSSIRSARSPEMCPFVDVSCPGRSCRRRCIGRLC